MTSGLPQVHVGEIGMVRTGEKDCDLCRDGREPALTGDKPTRVSRHYALMPLVDEVLLPVSRKFDAPEATPADNSGMFEKGPGNDC